MINVPFFEKISKFFNILINNNYALIIGSILLILLFIILFACKKNDKLIKVLYISLYAIILLGLAFRYKSYLLTLIDYLIENIVANLLFPNLAIYIGVLLILSIIVIVSIFSNKVKFYIKSINIVCFAIMQLFLYLIINNIITNNINVYEKLSIYTNQELLILVELSMQLFVVWICVLGIIKLIDYIMDRKVVVENSNVSNLVIENVKETYKLYDTENELIEYVPIKKIKKSL